MGMVDGRKRHLMVDTLGLLIAVVVSPASARDRDGAVALLRAAARRGRRRLEKAWADNAYHGSYRDWARRELGIEIQVVAQNPGSKGRGFQVLPRRWVVERTHAWISRRRRRCARDYERLPAHHAGMVQLAAIIQMTRRLAKTADNNPATKLGSRTGSIGVLKPHGERRQGQPAREVRGFFCAPGG